MVPAYAQCMNKNDLETERTNYWYYFRRKLNHAHASPDLAIVVSLALHR